MLSSPPIGREENQQQGGGSSSSTSYSSIRQLNKKPENQWLERLKLFDFYPKLDDDVPRQKTTFGGAITCICLIITVYLLVSEIYFYTFPIREHSLKVDVTRGSRLPINIDIHFPELVCTDITIDVVDGIDGRPIRDAAYQIIKQRLDSKGVPFAEGKALAGSKGIFSKFECTKCELPINRKHSLFYKQKCCNTCEDLRTFYRLNRIPQNSADTEPQCLIEKPVTDDEGCRIYGTLVVQKMKGDFHILAGTSTDEKHDDHVHHVHHINRDTFKRIDQFNITHHIHQFSFGDPIDGLLNPLEGEGILVKGLGVQTYYIQVVPTIYKKNDYVLETNQYSFTRDYKSINVYNLGQIFPGIYFKYDMSPLMIEVDQSSKPFSELVTSICAIGGGMYVAFGLLYNITYKLFYKITNKKKH